MEIGIVYTGKENLMLSKLKTIACMLLVSLFLFSWCVAVWILIIKICLTLDH